MSNTQVICYTLNREPHVIDLQHSSSDDSQSQPPSGYALNSPTSICYAPELGYVIVDAFNSNIFQFHEGQFTPILDSAAATSLFSELQIASICYSAWRSVLLADDVNHVVFEIPLRISSTSRITGDIQILAGKSTRGNIKPGFKDGKLLEAKFNAPRGICCSMWGDVFISDSHNHRIRLIRDEVTTIAGCGKRGFLDGPKYKCRFDTPVSSCISPQGELFICDFGNKRIRLLDNSGDVTTLAGDGNEGLGDGEHLESSFSGPISITFTHQGDLLVVDKNIRCIQLNGLVSTLAESRSIPPHRTLHSSNPVVDSSDTALHIPTIHLSHSVDDIADHNLLVPTMEVNASTPPISPQRPRRHSWTDTFVKSFKSATSIHRERWHAMLARPVPNLQVPPTEVVRQPPTSSNHLYNVADASFDDFLQKHESFISLGGLCIGENGALVFTDPIRQRIFAIPGAMSLMYPTSAISKRTESFPVSSTFSSAGKAGGEEDHPANLDLSYLLRAPSPFSDYTISIVDEDGSSFLWKLHSIVLLQVCPSLLCAQTITTLQSQSIPVSSMNSLIHFIYADELPPDAKTSPRGWCDLEVLARLVSLPALAQYCRYKLYRKLCILNNLEQGIQTLSYILHHCNRSKELMETVIEFINWKQLPRKTLVRRLSGSTGAAMIKEISNRNTPFPYPDEFESTAGASILLTSTISSSSSQSQRKKIISASAPEIMRVPDEDIPQVVSRVGAHGKMEHKPDLKLHDCNRINIFGQLRTHISSLHLMLRCDIDSVSNSTMPYPELLVPDFFIHVGHSYVPCHGAILYALWPYFANLVDSKAFPPSAQLFPFSIPIPSSSDLSSATSSNRQSPLAQYSWHSRKSNPRLKEMIVSHIPAQRSVDIPAGTLSEQFVIGLIWYLYSNQVNQIPQRELCEVIPRLGVHFGFIDAHGNTGVPFVNLITHWRGLAEKPITLENCFYVLDTSRFLYGSHEEAAAAWKFIKDNIDAIRKRPDLNEQLMQLPTDKINELTS